MFNRPASPQVARLLGIQNLSPGTVAEPGAITAGAHRISAPTGDPAPGSEILWTIRPDHVTLADRGGYPWSAWTPPTSPCGRPPPPRRPRS